MGDKKQGSRIVEMIKELHEGKVLNIHQLTSRYKVNKRTIQRDFADIREQFPLVRTEKGIELDKAGDKKIINEFKEILGLNDILSSSKLDIMKVISERDSTIELKKRQSQDLVDKRTGVETIVKCINKRQRLMMDYNNKTYHHVEPYSIVLYREVWYLAAVHNDKLKAFRLIDIRPWEEKATFIRYQEIEEKIASEESIWYSDEKTPVVVHVDKKAAYYFKRKALLPNQQHIISHDDGSLTIHCQISHERQLLPVIQYWIPLVKIVQPFELQIKIINRLQGYMDDCIHS